METTRTPTDPFARLDSLFLSTGTFSDNASASDSSSWFSDSLAEAKTISANTADKAYRKLTSCENVTSYSLLTQLHECPRKYELEKLQANHASSLLAEPVTNIDFAYGHAVGSGIQTYAATGSVEAGIFAAMLAWRAPYDAEKLDARGNPTGKSLAMATLAVEKFSGWWQEHMSDWEVVVLPSGKKAVELAFAVDFQNGRYHFGHIDVLLRNKQSGTLAVWEGKTTGFENVKEAVYANSSQALGYSVVVDAIAKEIGADGTEYEVLYIVYSSKSREFQLLPFGKTRSQRAEWLQDTLLDHASLDTYKRIKFYPKRGENCVSKYGFVCKWFGNCTMRNESLFPGLQLPVLEPEQVASVEALDFVFKLDDLVSAQNNKATDVDSN